MKLVVNAVKAAALATVTWGQAHAGMPVVAPSNGVQSNSGDYIGLAKAYFGQAASLIALVIVSAMLIRVVNNMLTTYATISDGKGTWADLVKHGLAGAVLAAVAIFLATQVASIFS